MKKTILMLVALGSLTLGSGVAFADPPGDRHGALGPARATHLRERIERRMAHARQRVDALAAQGRVGPALLARFHSLEARARQTVDRVFADGQVTFAERDELRTLRREARQLRREMRRGVRRGPHGA